VFIVLRNLVAIVPRLSGQVNCEAKLATQRT